MASQCKRPERRLMTNDELLFLALLRCDDPAADVVGARLSKAKRERFIRHERIMNEHAIRLHKQFGIPL